MFVQQISVFLENTPGTLRDMTETLGKGGIDLLALSIADTQSFGIVRLIVSSDQLDPALALLREGRYIARRDPVICAAVPDRPGGLASLLSVIEEAGLSVEYMYSFLRAAKTGAASLILRLSDGRAALHAFEEHGIAMLSQEDVDRL